MLYKLCSHVNYQDFPVISVKFGIVPSFHCYLQFSSGLCVYYLQCILWNDLLETSAFELEIHYVMDLQDFLVYQLRVYFF